MRSAMSDFIETNNFNKFSLDLNLGEQGSLCISFFRLLSAILDSFIFPGISSWSRQIRRSLEVGKNMYSRDGYTGQCSISPAFNRIWEGIIFTAFVIIRITIKGEEVLITICANPPSPPGSTWTFPCARKDQLDAAPNRRNWCRCLLLNNSANRNLSLQLQVEDFW